MKELCEIEYVDIKKNKKNEDLIKKVVQKCFEIEHLKDLNLYVSITLTTPENIKKINNQFRNIDNETDVLSFPMFEKEEIDNLIKSGKNENLDILGDMVISIPKIEEQAIEYGHSFERELSYMVVHSFYHLMGYDHIKEEDKRKMRVKEEFILSKL